MNTARTLAATALAAAALLGAQTVATAQVDPTNRMDLGEFYAIHLGDTQTQVEAACDCTGNWLDRWTTVDGVTHKRVAYDDADDHAFQIDYYRTASGTWAAELKSIHADGVIFPFKSDRSG